MRIIGCDLHARQQTLAMLDTETGEVVNRTLMHEGNQVREFIPNFRVRCWWASKPLDPCSGFWICWRSWESTAGWETPLRFVRRNPASRNMTGATPS